MPSTLRRPLRQQPQASPTDQRHFRVQLAAGWIQHQLAAASSTVIRGAELPPTGLSRLAVITLKTTELRRSQRPVETGCAAPNSQAAAGPWRKIVNASHRAAFARRRAIRLVELVGVQGKSVLLLGLTTWLN